MSRLYAVAIALLYAAGATHVAARRALPRAGLGPGAVGIQMRNVDLRFADGVVLQVRGLNGKLHPTGRRPVTLDDRTSFTVEADSAVLAIAAGTLARLLNTYVFAYPGAPLKNLTVAISAGRIIVKGTMHKGLDLPFELAGSVSAAEDGNIRVHADRFKSDHIPFKGLLHLIGEDLSKLVNLNQARGVRMEGDDLLLFPSRMMPAPHIFGRVTDAHVEGGAIVEVFGGRAAPTFPLPEPAANYIYHRGGTLRFGKLTMADTDLEIIDEDPADPFDFSLDDYNRQLAAGYSRNTLSHGLIVHMPDYARLNHTVPPR